MLEKCDNDVLSFDDNPERVAPYEVGNPRITILSNLSAEFTAQFSGPPGTRVIGRAWISDMDGTIVDGETGEIDAGSESTISLTIPKAKVQNGNLIACMRVEWPLFQTKHVVQCTLLKGEIIHPPKGNRC